MKFNEHPLYVNRFKGMTLKINPATSNVWAIGDVHGCADEFRELCYQIREEDPNAIIIQLGDLIDRGPYVKEIFDVVEKYDVLLCLGNHELSFLMEHNKNKKCNSNARLVTHRIFDHYKEDDQNYILNTIRNSHNYIKIEMNLFPDDIHSPNTEWYLSHSPIKDFEKTNKTENFMMTNALDFCSRNDPYIDDELGSNELFVHGHQHWNYTLIEKQTKRLENGDCSSLNIDGGCVYGGELVAYNLCTNDHKIIKPKKTYFKK